ncbi:MAG: amino acid adenylation domain-containing protein [Synechococcales cyanobacterium M58_A2018_015]|nr:amino acid adenylation domain-containing protein [Synechococcales cyanobacterium M58_A2018_015]
MPPSQPSKPIDDLYPLSPLQQGMLFHTLLSPQAGIYVPQIVLTLEGKIDVQALKHAWQQVIAQHPVLRTGFQWEKRDQPFQVVYRQVELPWQELDWRGSSPSHLEAFLAADRQRGFDLKTPPLMRLSLIRVAADRYYLIWTQHHLILDGWSAALVLSDVVAAYAGKPIAPRPPYRQHIAWLQQQDPTTAQAFWTGQLRGFREPTRLPIAQPTPSSTPAWEEQHFSLSEATTAALKTLAQQHHLTLNTIVQGGFALLLSRYTDRDEVCFGATYSGRRQPGTETMVGLLINTLPIRLSTAPAPLIPWLQQIQTQQAVALQYDYCSLLDIQAWSEIPPGTPLFESLLVFENYPVDASSIQSSALPICQIQPIEWTSVPITLIVSGSDCLSFKLKFERHRFPLDGMQRLLIHLHHLFITMAEQPNARLEEFSLITPAERQQLSRWNQTEADYPLSCLPDLFEAQVERTPDAIAVLVEGQLDPSGQNHRPEISHLTYCDLNHRANQLAHYLQSHGVRSETIVGIRTERSLDLVISLLAVLKAGAAYLPLDPALPPERLAWMETDAQVSLVLPVAIDSAYPVTNPTRSLHVDNSVYVIYTSGSTGVPKGVINTHRSLVNRLTWMQSTYSLTADDRVLQKTPCSFDVSVWEFFWPLITGASLVLAKPNGQKDSRYLANLIAAQQITILHFVPSMLQAFLDELDSNPVLELPALRHVFCSGEALPTALASRYFTRLKARLHNLYGPTEAAIDVAFQEATQPLPTTSTIPIGKPIHNIQLYVLDAHLHPVPIGVPGELYISGIGLARGYLRRPDLTAERFGPHPGPSREETEPSADSFCPQAGLRAYRTGDRCRYLPDGTIEYLGRLDHQVKLRGYRIELGEIEAVLLRHPRVQAAVVTLSDAEPPQLVAYLILHRVGQSITPNKTSDETPNEFSNLPAAFTEFLRIRLPDYMVPSQFIVLDAFPLLSNGKLNRRALPTAPAPRHPRIPPRNATEAAIAAIWAEVLHQDSIGVDDSFFELGGNSLLATRINSRLRQTFQLDLPLQILFEKPTIAALAERITALQIAQPLPHNAPLTASRKEIEL